MRTLVISDVHEQIDIVQRIKSQAGSVDHTVYLGDFLDSFYDGGLTDTAEFIVSEAQNPNTTILYGNHDLPYVFPSVFGLKCSGHDPLKLIPLKEALVVARQHFKFVAFIDGWVLTHAGFSKYMADKYLNDDLDAHLLKVYRTLAEGSLPELLRVGMSRGGNYKTGGITWLDWEEEFEPVPGVKQIVGHTRGKKPRWNGDNLCLDTNLKHYAIIEDGVVTTHDVVL